MFFIGIPNPELPMKEGYDFDNQNNFFWAWQLIEMDNKKWILFSFYEL